MDYCDYHLAVDYCNHFMRKRRARASCSTLTAAVALEINVADGEDDEASPKHRVQSFDSVLETVKSPCDQMH